MIQYVCGIMNNGNNSFGSNAQKEKALALKAIRVSAFSFYNENRDC